MAFYIKKHSENPASQFGGYANTDDIKMYLGVPFTIIKGQWDYVRVSRLDMDFKAEAKVPLSDGRETTLICTEGNPSLTGDLRGKRSKHRCFATCPDCGEVVPAGRTTQHKCK